MDALFKCNEMRIINETISICIWRRVVIREESVRGGGGTLRNARCE